jgi:hypothetical protein
MGVVKQAVERSLQVLVHGQSVELRLSSAGPLHPSGEMPPRKRLSHNDRDHSGNLMQVLDHCPNGTLVTIFIAVGRMIEYQLQLNRMRWVNDVESWSVGDRTLEAFAAPLFDGPGTRGLWDATSGVYY